MNMNYLTEEKLAKTIFGGDISKQTCFKPSKNDGEKVGLYHKFFFRRI